MLEPIEHDELVELVLDYIKRQHDHEQHDRIEQMQSDELRLLQHIDSQIMLEQRVFEVLDLHELEIIFDEVVQIQQI